MANAHGFSYFERFISSAKPEAGSIPIANTRMNISHEVTPERDVTLTIELSVEESDPRIQAAFETFRKQARISGFRQGKVPLGFIKTRYGREIVADTVDELAKEKLREALLSEKLEPAGRITMNLLEYGEGKPLRYEVMFPLRPEVTVGTYTGIRLALNDAEVGDEEVDKQIEGLRMRNAHLHSVEGPAPVGSFVTLKVQEVHPSGLQLIGRPVEEKQIEFGTDALGVGSDEQLLGIKEGEKRMVRVRAPQSGVVGATGTASILTPNQATGRESGTDEFTHYSVEAVRVEVPHLPEVDDDFAQGVNPGLKNVEDLRNYLKFMMLGYVAQRQQEHLQNGLIGYLIDQNPFPMPRGVIESTFEELAGGMKLTAEEFEKFKSDHWAEAERDYRWVLIRDEIARRENLDVNDEEVEQEMVRLSERSGESLSTIRRRYTDEDKLDNLKGRLLERRVLSFLAENAEIERRKMPLVDFMKWGE